MLPKSSNPWMLLLAAALATPARAAAGDSADPLGALVDEALQKNLTVQSARLAEQRAQSELTATRLQWLPSVRLEARGSRLHDVQDIGALVNPAYAALNQLTNSQAFPTDVSFTLPQAYESHVRITQPLLNEPLRAGVSAASAARDAQSNVRAVTARAVAAGVQGAWLAQASATRIVGVYEASLPLVLENERVATRLLEAGQATPEAVHRARADRAEVEQALADAREQASAATRAFNRLMARPADAPIEPIADSLFTAPLTLDESSAVRSALSRREELAASAAAVRAADAMVRVHTGAFLPSVAGAIDVGWQGSEATLSGEDRSWTASLVASWDLFRGGSDVARRSAAAREAERQRVEQRDLAERIALEARDAHAAASVAYAALGTAATRAEAARRTYALVHRRFEEGSASPLEVTQARTDLTTAESNEILTRYRYALRKVELERAAALRDLAPAKGRAADRGYSLSTSIEGGSR